MLCVLILYISGGTYSLKSTRNDRFFLGTFHGNFIYSQSFCQKSAELMSGLGLEPRLFIYHKIRLALKPTNKNELVKEI